MKWLTRWLRTLGMSHLQRLEFDLMSASEDLVTNVANLQAAEVAYTAAVAAKLAEAPGDDPNVVAANAALVSVTESLAAATAALNPAPAASTDADPSADASSEQPAQ